MLLIVYTSVKEINSVNQKMKKMYLRFKNKPKTSKLITTGNYIFSKELNLWIDVVNPFSRFEFEWKEQKSIELFRKICRSTVILYLKHNYDYVRAVAEEILEYDNTIYCVSTDSDK